MIRLPSTTYLKHMMLLNTCCRILRNNKGRDQDEYALAETNRERSTPVKAARVEQHRMALRAASRTDWRLEIGD
jgi:hypothetical protein